RLFPAFAVNRHPARSALFPYTRLCRSLRRRPLRGGGAKDLQSSRASARTLCDGARRPPLTILRARERARRLFHGARRLGARARRSEEHTSELQSRENLVCRLLLEKKKH